MAACLQAQSLGQRQTCLLQLLQHQSLRLLLSQCLELLSQQEMCTWPLELSQVPPGGLLQLPVKG